MPDDVMARLMAVKALPRGERIAKFYESLPRKTRHYVPLWCRLVEQGCIGAVDARFNRKGTDTAAAWRVYAAPLRKAREQRQYAWACANVLRREVERLRGHLYLDEVPAGAQHDPRHADPTFRETFVTDAVTRQGGDE